MSTVVTLKKLNRDKCEVLFIIKNSLKYNIIRWNAKGKRLLHKRMWSSCIIAAYASTDNDAAANKKNSLMS